MVRKSRSRRALRRSNDKSYRAAAEKEICAWENESPGYVAQIGDALLRPAQMAAEKLIPTGVQDAVGRAIIASLTTLSDASERTLDKKAIAKKVRGHRIKLGDDLKASDAAAKEYWSWNVRCAVMEGGVTGATGWPGLIADVPLLFGISLRTIQQIAICYGYDITKDAEREYIVQILRVGSSGDIKAKVEFLIGLKQVEQVLLKVTWKKMNEALARKEISRLSLLAAIRQFAKSLGIQITKRKALQLVPFVGALIGAAFNATFVNDVGRAAHMSYRRRKMIEEVSR